MIVFVATVQENSSFIETLRNAGILVMHPFFNFSSEEGKDILEKLKDEPPSYENKWETLVRKDIYCLKASKLVLYDLDNCGPEGRYLSMAVALRKPVICVSETLKPVSVYFSGSILAVVKPSQILPMLTFIHENKSFLELPKKVVQADTKKAEEIKDERILSDTGLPA